MGMYVKVVNLVILNLRYEKISFNHEQNIHPYILLNNLIEEQLVQLKGMQEILFAGNDQQPDWSSKSVSMEEKHLQLYNGLWDKKQGLDLKAQIERYRFRLKINNLEDTIRDKVCLDVGCGNGSFCFALAELGAGYIEGIDYGENSIRYAEQLRHRLQLSEKTHFTLGSVYALPYKKDFFNMVIQNGVCHHLENENHAIREMARVIKPGGLLWYYTEGEGALHNELFEMSCALLKDVPIDFVKRVLVELHLLPNKIHYLMDRLNATYRKTTWKEITERLASFGFGNFRRFKSGFKWAFDQEVIESDPYGQEKFGEGTIRILAEHNPTN